MYCHQILETHQDLQTFQLLADCSISRPTDQYQNRYHFPRVSSLTVHGGYYCYLANAQFWQGIHTALPHGLNSYFLASYKYYLYILLVHLKSNQNQIQCCHMLTVQNEQHITICFHSILSSTQSLDREGKKCTLELQTADPDASWIAQCHIITLLTDKRDVRKDRIIDCKRKLLTLQFLQNLNAMGTQFCQYKQ